MDTLESQIESAAQELSIWVCKNLKYGCAAFDGSNPFAQILRKHFKPAVPAPSPVQGEKN